MSPKGSCQKSSKLCQNEEVMAMNWPSTSGVVFLSFAIKLIKRIMLF